SCSILKLTELILNSLPIFFCSVFKELFVSFLLAARFGDFIRLPCRNPRCQQLFSKTFNRLCEAHQHVSIPCDEE
ncbi:hypothetical protein, partial [Fictibacillus norfolkensis]|uniref:hypothetical protein n=1 Tax=Fictibacillus norfolkensis TaxID=2762233 RepID=UPI001CD8C555